MSDGRKKIIQGILIIAASTALTVLLTRWVAAGSLTPPGTNTTSTLVTLQNIYDSIASTTFSSASISASTTGSVIQLARCIANRVTGGTCP